MKKSVRYRWPLSILVLLCGALFCGCGEGYQRTSAGVPGGAGGVASPLPSSGTNVEGNWQFSMTSTVSDAPPLTIGGSISPSGSSVSGAVHINGSKCFDPLRAVGLTGTLTGNNLVLTSTSVAGQVVTFTGNLSDYSPNFSRQFTGTYTIDGGCASGDEGNVAGVSVPSMTRNWAGDLTSGTGYTNRMGITLAQGAATSAGIFGLGGTVWFEGGTCFSSGTIVSGTFPSGSYVTGESVSLEVETDNGHIAFLGKAEGDGLIRGNYTLTNSTCEPTGTWYLSPWEY